MLSPEVLVRRARHRSHPPRHVVAFALACGRVTWECRGLRTLKRGECGATVHPGDRRGSYTEALARHRIGGRFGLRSSLSELAYLRQYASGSPRLLWPADSSGSPGPNVSESTPRGEASPPPQSVWPAWFQRLGSRGGTFAAAFTSAVEAGDSPERR